MTDLSPHVQAVWDAYERVDCDPYEIDPRKAGLSAALEAVADQVAPGPWRVNSCCDQREHSVRGGILAIAAELRGQTQPSSEEP